MSSTHVFFRAEHASKSPNAIALQCGHVKTVTAITVDIVCTENVEVVQLT